MSETTVLLLTLNFLLGHLVTLKEFEEIMNTLNSKYQIHTP